MFFVGRSVKVLFGLVFLAGSSSVQAAELAGAEITKMISDHTVYIEFDAANVGTGPGAGVMHYTADGKVAAKFPNGTAPKGVWVIKDNTSCITWDGRPPNPCTKFDKQGEVVILINTADGKPRGKIVKTAPGNPEKL